MIGITTYGREDGRYHLPAEYVDAVRRAGGVAVLLPPGDGQTGEVLDRLDGFVLAGGGDLDPALYGATRHPATGAVDAERDAVELALVQAIVDHRLPALAVCRGCQVLNVAFGGTLHQHLPDVVGNRLLHRAPDGDEAEQPRHAVEVEPDSEVAAAMGATRPEPISWHHQAAERVAPALRVVARAADGTVEALELPGHPELLAVQWHPERTAHEDPSQQRLFDALVAAARERRRARR